MDVGVERHVRPRRGVERADRFEKRSRDRRLSSRGASSSKRVGLFLGDARDAVFLAQQVHDLLVEDLPGEQARLVHHLAAVFGVSVGVEIEALVDEALAERVDDDAERIVVLLEAVADIEVAERRRVQIPLHRMAPDQWPADGGADIERHLEPLAGVVLGAAHLGQIPIGAEIARAHLGIGLEPAAGEHHRL